MSVATAMNLAIAVIEQKPAIGRSIYRSLPLDDMKGLLHVAARLEQAVQKRIDEGVQETLMRILTSSMVVRPGADDDSKVVEAFMEGVVLMESAIEVALMPVRRRLGLPPFLDAEDPSKMSAVETAEADGDY